MPQQFYVFIRGLLRSSGHAGYILRSYHNPSFDDQRAGEPLLTMSASEALLHQILWCIIRGVNKGIIGVPVSSFFLFVVRLVRFSWEERWFVRLPDLQQIPLMYALLLTRFIHKSYYLFPSLCSLLFNLLFWFMSYVYVYGVKSFVCNRVVTNNYSQSVLQNQARPIGNGIITIINTVRCTRGT